MNGSALLGLIPLVPGHFYIKKNMKKLFRKRNSKFAGICSGLADYLGIDESVVKVIFIVSIFTPIPIIFTYLVLWMVIPKEPKI